MIGLLVVVVGTIYLALLIWATRAAYLWAKSRGFSKRKCWAAAAIGFLAVYLPVFWDFVPTIFAKQYLCATQAGFVTIKTVDQWRKENPDVLVAIAPPHPAGSPSKNERFDDGHIDVHTFFLNERFRWVITQQDLSRLLLIIRREEVVLDAGKNEVLARFVDFGTGNSVKNSVGPPGPLKFWLSSGGCREGDLNQDKLRKIRNEYKTIRGTK